MAKKDLTVEVSAAWHEVFSALHVVAKAAKDAGADGWQAGTDIPAIVMAAVGSLPAAVNKIGDLDDEWAEDPAASLKAASLVSMDLVALFTKKPDA